MGRLNCVCLLLAGLLLSALSTAAEDDTWLLSKYDRNGDDTISQQEVISKKLNIFRHLDRDKDGVVTFSEYEAMDSARRENLLKNRFSRVDANADGRVSEREYSQYLGLFERIDSNGDGRLSEEEIRLSQNGGEDHYCLLWLCLRTSLN